MWMRLGIAAVGWSLATLGHAVTVDELVQKHVDARGGIDKIRALQSVRFTGKMQFAGDFSFELELNQVVARGKVRNEASVQGLTAVQAYDGKDAWSISPFQGRKDPERMSADDAKDLVEQADLDGPLIDAAKKGIKLEYLGTEDVDGTLAYKIRATRPTGDVETVFLDPDYYLEVRSQTKRVVRGTESESETDYGDYEKVGGVYFPMSMESGPKGGRKGQKVTMDKAEANVAVEPSAFAFPSTPAAH